MVTSKSASFGKGLAVASEIPWAHARVSHKAHGQRERKEGVPVMKTHKGLSSLLISRISAFPLILVTNAKIFARRSWLQL
jgi:hypothetical protein